MGYGNSVPEAVDRGSLALAFGGLLSRAWIYFSEGVYITLWRGLVNLLGKLGLGVAPGLFLFVLVASPHAGLSNWIRYSRGIPSLSNFTVAGDWLITARGKVRM